VRYDEKSSSWRREEDEHTFIHEIAIAELLHVFSRLAENPVLSNFNP
jgi:hypothetical protein